MVREEDPPQRQCLPRVFETYTHGNVESMVQYPISGTKICSQSKTFPSEKEPDYHCHKEQEQKANIWEQACQLKHDDGQATDSRRERLKCRTNVSFTVYPPQEPPLPADVSTIPPNATNQPPAPAVRTTHVQQVAYYHMWSVYNPTTPTLSIDQYPPAAFVHDSPSPNHHQSPIPPHEQRAMGASSSFSVLQGPAIGPSSQPDTTHVAANAYIATSPTTTPGPKAGNGSPWMSPPQVPLAAAPDNQQTGEALSSSSAHATAEVNPAPPAAETSAWSTDSFMAAYQHYCMPHPSSPGTAPGSGLIDNHLYALEPANVLQAHSTQPSFSYSATMPAGWYPRDTCQPSNAMYVTPRAVTSSTWSGPPATLACANHERFDGIENAANDGYAYGQDVRAQPSPLVAHRANYTTHPPHTPPQGSYSELLQALRYPPHDFTGDCAPHSETGFVTKPHTKVPAEPNTIRYTGSSQSVLGAESLGPVTLAPPSPPSIAGNKEEWVQIFQECIDRNDRLEAEASALLLSLG